MKRSRLAGFGTVALALTCLGMLLSSASAQKAKEKKREASIHQLMEGFVSVNCGALGKDLKAKEPNWKKIATHAAMLNEAGHILMADGRCPDADWAKGAKTVQTCSKVILGKVAKKDLEGARGAFKALTSGGCKTCHDAHRHKK